MPTDKNSKPDAAAPLGENRYLAIGIGVGLPLGMAISLVTEQWAFMGAGLAIGVAIGVSLGEQEKKKNRPAQPAGDGAEGLDPEGDETTGGTMERKADE